MIGLFLLSFAFTACQDENEEFPRWLDLQWVKMKSLPYPIPMSQKAVFSGNDIFIYGDGYVMRGTMNEHTSEISSWGRGEMALPNNPLTSLVYFNKKIYASFVSGKVHSTTDGLSWNEETMLGSHVEKLLAAFPNSLTAIVTDTEGRHFAKSDGVTGWVAEEDTVPETFPRNDVTSVVYTSPAGVSSAMLVGTPNETNQYTVPWFTTEADPEWTEMNTAPGTGTPYPACPYMKNPTIIHLDNAFYLFGEDADGFIKSTGGGNWYPANSEFRIPEEFKNKSDRRYSMVMDKKGFIWIICNDGEVWRGQATRIPTLLRYKQ